MMKKTSLGKIEQISKQCEQGSCKTPVMVRQPDAQADKRVAQISEPTHCDKHKK